MPYVLEITSDTNHDEILASPVWDSVPRVGEAISLVDGPQWRKFWVTGIEYVCDVNANADIPHVAVYVAKAIQER